MTSSRPRYHFEMAPHQLEWVAQYPIIADLVGRGFVPEAYGNPDGSGYAIPTKFHYPDGGMEHPFHVSPAQGARFAIYSFSSDRPLEETSQERVWHVSRGSHITRFVYPRLEHQYVFTLCQAADLTVEAAQACVDSWIVPVWTETQWGRQPALPFGQWRELLAGHRTPVAAVGQLSLFTTEPPSWADRAADIIEAALSGPAAEDPDRWVTILFPVPSAFQDLYEKFMGPIWYQRAVVAS